MFDKKLVYALLLSFGTVWLFNHYFFKPANIHDTTGGVGTVGQVAAPVVAGAPIKVMSLNQLATVPLNYEVAFSDDKIKASEDKIVVATPNLKATFSSFGGILTSLDFEKHAGKHGSALRTVQDKGVYQDEAKQKGCFLLALDADTPYYYSLVSNQEKSGSTELVFKAENKAWEIEKKYVLYHATYKVDVVLSFAPKVNEPVSSVHPRLFVAAPYVAEVADDIITPFRWNDMQGAVEKLPMVVDEKAATGQRKPITGLDDLFWYWSGKDAMVGAENHYFVHALVGDTGKFVQRAYFKIHDAKTVLSILEGPEIVGKQSWTLSFYMGPKLFQDLDAVDTRLEEVLSFGWLSWLCKLLLQLLAYLYKFVGNFGWAIILMTVLIKLPFTPLTIYSRRRMEEYQQYQPTINKIRAKYRQDWQKQQEELMRFYQEHNISPVMHMVGCLPLLIQMPILLALYRVLHNYLDLYQAPFMGWIVDLSVKDPYYILPILMGIAMLWQQSMSPVKDDKMRVAMMFMPVVMVVVFLNFPSGLVLYWLVNNVLTIGEDYIRKYLLS